MLLEPGQAVASFDGGPWDGASGSIPAGGPPAPVIFGDRCLLGHWHQFVEGHYRLAGERWEQRGGRQVLVAARYRWCTHVASPTEELEVSTSTELAP